MLNESMKQYPCPTFKFNTITSGKSDNLGTEQEQSGNGKKVLAPLSSSLKNLNEGGEIDAKNVSAANKYENNGEVIEGDIILLFD